jgi:peptidoglycan/xylan/chitin deacetylase (PgdA/CDA1 family)
VKGARLVKTYTPVWERTLAILAYHKIGPAPGGWETWYYVSEPTFAAHLAYLQDEGWEFLDLQGLLHCLEEPDRLPARAALITFDDGYRSLLKHALPVLRRFDCPAVVFVPTDFIGGRNTFDEGNEPAEPICGWDDLRVLEREGVAVQSHGASHRPLSGLSPARREVELVGSRITLEQGLGRPVVLFSYPYGDGGADSTALGRAGYRAACLYNGAVNAWPADPYRLDRLTVGPDTDLEAELASRRQWA